MAGSLKVGIIGASAEGGWANVSHAPAVKGLDGLELAAVATRSRSTAEAAAHAFGAPKAFDDPLAMIRDPEIDIVSVCVRVPAHRDFVLGALQAGKHVYCEWPLGRDSAETEMLASAAREAGPHTAIGLQTRENPAARRARAMIAAGDLGRPLSARVTSATAAFGPDVPDAMLYAEDPASGVDLVTIQGMHTLDLAIALLGPFADIAAIAHTQYPEIRAGDAGTARPRTIPDHLVAQARLDRGGTLAAEIIGGRPPETPFRFEVIGEAGTLVLDGGALRGFQSGRLALTVNGERVAVDEGEEASMPDEAVNVAAVYVCLRDDIRAGTASATNFDHAARLSRLVDAVMASSADGVRRTARDWPDERS